jgi:hypothetical protein
VLIREKCGGNDVISNDGLSVCGQFSQFTNSVTERNAACLYPLELSKCTAKRGEGENIKISYGGFGIYGITEARTVSFTYQLCL